jgi:hypothetical protein
MASSPKNNLVRGGLFYEGMQDAIKTTRDFVKESSGDEPSEAEIALSLKCKCSFILSEIKNQIDWQRQDAQKTDETEFNLE